MILNDVENGKYSGLILINFQKVFDPLNKKILLQKMTCIGFSDKSIKCFHSYLLTNRALIVSLGTAFSKDGLETAELPQIFGPLLFLLYINDIQQALSATHTNLHTGNTSIFSQHNDVVEIENILNN